MEIIKNAALKDLNTFRVNATAQLYTEIHNMDDIAGLLDWKSVNLKQHNLPSLILGGGSNLLFKSDYQGLVAKVCLVGKDVADQDDKQVVVSVAAGENWHDFVRWTVSQGFAGLENLSLIPGTVGAAPIQNIGAYGVELADHFDSLQAVDLDTGEVLQYQKSACQFGYRESIFKTQTLDKLLITSLNFVLTKQSNQTEWKTDYAGVREALQGKQLTAKLISDAIIKIRQTKLPDPAEIGNAGSFFKNPVLNERSWNALKGQYSDLPGYVQANGDMKTSAAWLIDQCGWKGYQQGDAGVSEKHALVLVNHNNATGVEIWTVAEQIMSSVKDRFGVSLEAEPRVIS